MDQNRDYQIFNEEIEFKLKEIGDFIGGNLPEGWGYTLLLFDFNAGGSLFYAANANREDILAMMKEFIALNERKNKEEEKNGDQRTNQPPLPGA